MENYGTLLYRKSVIAYQSVALSTNITIETIGYVHSFMSLKICSVLQEMLRYKIWSHKPFRTVKIQLVNLG